MVTLLRDHDPMFIPHPLAKIDQPPAHDTVSRRRRSALDDGFQCQAVSVSQARRLAGWLAVDQTIWATGVQHQASDRAHRIGQDKAVFVYKLIAADTVEDRILELQQRKAKLASIALSEEGNVAGLDAEDMLFLFGDSRGYQEGGCNVVTLPAVDCAV